MTLSCRCSRVIVGIFLCCVGPGINRITIAAEEHAVETADTPALRHSESRGWQVAESTNFRIHHLNQAVLVTRLAKLCEESRSAISQRWLGSTYLKTWSIKCDVYLYPTAAGYQRQTRCSADSWGMADLEIGQGKVWLRRLYLRSDHEAHLTAVTVHELAHVVLADRFAQRRLPRWADEGIALNSEPLGRQHDMRQWLVDEVRQGRGFTLPQLIALQQYPGDKCLGHLFYAQSGSFVEFLLSRNSEEEVLQIVESFQQQHSDQKRNMSLGQLEAEWKAWLLRRAPRSVSDR